MLFSIVALFFWVSQPRMFLYEIWIKEKNWFLNPKLYISLPVQKIKQFKKRNVFSSLCSYYNVVQRFPTFFWSRAPSRKRKLTYLLESWEGILRHFPCVNLKLMKIRRALSPLKFLTYPRSQFHQYFTRPFLYESILRSFSLVTVWLCHFFGAKVVEEIDYMLGTGDIVYYIKINSRVCGRRSCHV